MNTNSVLRVMNGAEELYKYSWAVMEEEEICNGVRNSGEGQRTI